MHPDVSEKERARLLQKAKKTKPSHIEKDVGQTTLTLKSNVHTPKETKAQDKVTTRSLGRFDATHPELVSFKQYLMGLDGKMRSESSADSIATDISKVLYATGKEKLDMANLTDRKKLLLFIDQIKEIGVGPEGQLTKLERLCDCYEYLRKTRGEDDDLMKAISGIQSDVNRWKKTLRGEKQKLVVQRLEKTSDMELTLESITSVVDCEELWVSFSNTIDRIKRREEVTNTDLKLAMSCVMLCVKLKSMQKPGAVCNCTIEEYRAVRFTNGAYVIKVKEHKTSQLGTAKLTMDPVLMNRLRFYFKYIRPCLAEPGKDSDRLFILPGSVPITKFSNIESFVKRLNIPTSTMARKIATTCAARSLGESANTLITAQMSHQPAVSNRHYRAIRGSQDAATAFMAIEKLRTSGDAAERPRHTAAGTFRHTAAPSAAVGNSCQALEPAQQESSRTWSASDTNFVKKKIKKRETPTLVQCSELGLAKSAKQVQDKVRTLIRQAQNAQSE